MPTSTGGTTITFTVGNSAVSLGVVQSIRQSDTAAELDVTDINSNSYHIFEAGLSQKELTVGVKGAAAVAVGSSGTIALGWNDTGNSITLATTYVCLAANKSGEVGGQSTTEYTFKPAT